MKAWLQALAPRERLVVVGGSIVLLGVLVYLAVIEPMAAAYAQREARVAELEREVAWMRGAAAELRALGAADPAAGGDRRPPYLAADRALRESGLRRPERLEPVGADGARIELEGVAFDRLIPVLERLRTRDRLRIERARFERTGTGLVNASIDLERMQ